MRYRITFDKPRGVYTAYLALPLEDGNFVLITAQASIADTLKDFGFSDTEVGNIFSDIGKGLKKLGKGIGKAVKKVTKSKALRKVLSVGKEIIKNPITTAALGAVSGGTLLAPMAAANAAVRLAEVAAKNVGKAGKSARKLLKATAGAADKKEQRKAKLRTHKKALIRASVKNPLLLAMSKIQARKKRILRIANKLQAGKTPPMLPATTQRAATAKSAADFLVNVHFA
jgi:hypothetical protein